VAADMFRVASVSSQGATSDVWPDSDGPHGPCFAADHC
jgi:hypothetical protein